MKKIGKNRRALIGKAAVLAVFALSLSGCMFDASIESLLSPPKLTEVQTAIYNALILNTGSQIELVYPRTGEYRSPFVLYDLDGAGTSGTKTEEAMVFYRESSVQNQSESSLRLNILDQRDGKWVSVCDRPLTGVDIESVSFHSFMGSDRPDSILVSCSVLSQTENSLYVMEYTDSELREHYRGSYSFMEIIKPTEKDEPKLFLVSFDPLTNSNMAYMMGKYSYKEEEGISPEAELQFDTISAISLYPDVASIQRLTRQRISDRDFLIFLDYSKGDNAYGSQVLRCSNDYLTQVQSEDMSRRNNSFVPMLYSTDIDGDGRIEIPATIPMCGYEHLTIPEQMLSVEWYFADEENNFTVTKKFTTYMSAGGEYIFYIPVRWQEFVSADRANNTVNFRRYDFGSMQLCDIILSICVSSEIPAANDGWELYGKSGESNIYIRFPNPDDSMVLTKDEMERCLYLNEARSEK